MKKTCNADLNDNIIEYYENEIAYINQLIDSGANTPFSVFNPKRAINNLQLFKLIADDNSIKLKINFAVKSCYVSYILNAISPYVDSFDVQSISEISLCPKNSNISFHSPMMNFENCKDKNIERISSIIINSIRQYEKTKNIDFLSKSRFGLRLALPKKIDTQFVSEKSKLGMTLDEILCLIKKYDMSSKDILYIHNHTHSRLSSVNDAMKVSKLLMNNIKKIENVMGDKFRSINIGGGWDGMLQLHLKHISLEEIFYSQINVIKNSSKSIESITIEPGRVVVEDSGIVVVSVVEIITKPEGNYLIIDSDSGFLIPIQLARFIVIPLSNYKKSLKKRYFLADGTCSPRGIVTEFESDIDFQEGMILGVLNTGGYTYGLSSFFHSAPPVAYGYENNNQLKDNIVLNPTQVSKAWRQN